LSEIVLGAPLAVGLLLVQVPDHRAGNVGDGLWTDLTRRTFGERVWEQKHPDRPRVPRRLARGAGLGAAVPGSQLLVLGAQPCDLLAQCVGIRALVVGHEDQSQQ